MKKKNKQKFDKFRTFFFKKTKQLQNKIFWAQWAWIEFFFTKPDPFPSSKKILFTLHTLPYPLFLGVLCTNLTFSGWIFHVLNLKVRICFHSFISGDDCNCVYFFLCAVSHLFSYLRALEKLIVFWPWLFFAPCSPCRSRMRRLGFWRCWTCCKIPPHLQLIDGCWLMGKKQNKKRIECWIIGAKIPSPPPPQPSVQTRRVPREPQHKS